MLKPGADNRVNQRKIAGVIATAKVGQSQPLQRREETEYLTLYTHLQFVYDEHSVSEHAH